MAEPNHDRVLAIDFGLKRVGLALSDPLKIFSYPYMTLSYDKQFLDRLILEVKKNNVANIILGYPLTSRGDKTPLSDEILKLKITIEQRLKIDVTLWDERFTSEIAKSKVFESVNKKSKRRDKGLLDQNAAAIMLQEYLDSAANNNRGKG